MFTKYTSILALATVALAAPLADPEACRAGVPMVTVTTYVTGYPPAATPPASSSDVAVPSPTPGAFYENVSPKPAKPNPPTTFSTLTAPSTPVAPPPPPPPPATYQPAPKPPQTTTTKASNPEPTYDAPPPPPPPPPPSNGPTYGTPPPKNGGSGTRSMTPHDKWSSSVGVVGCKINTNRVAYWPETPQIGRYCVKVSYKGRSVHLLHIDQSGGANDMSYDAWNYLATGKSATESPHCGGGINMEYEWVANSECSDLILDGSGKLPLLATNCEFALTAPEPRDQYVQLYNFKDLQCQMGVDEPCTVPDYAAGFNQPICPSGLGMSSASTGYVFKDLPYVTKANCPAAT